MQTNTLDTNVLVRFLVGDVPSQYSQAKDWLAEAEKGQREIWIPGLVIAESIYVLGRAYKKSFTEIAEALQTLISQKWLKVQEREILLLALKVYGQGTHFVDSYLLVTRQILGLGILTFDKKLSRQSKSEL